MAPATIRMPIMTIIMGQKVMLMLYVACRKKDKPARTMIIPITMPTIAAPFGRPKHSFSTRL